MTEIGGYWVIISYQMGDPERSCGGSFWIFTFNISLASLNRKTLLNIVIQVQIISAQTFGETFDTFS